jgi:hypothetical protein
MIQHECIKLGNGTIVSTRDELLDEIEKTAPGSRAHFSAAFDHWERAGLTLGDMFDRLQSLAKGART